MKATNRHAPLLALLGGLLAGCAAAVPAQEPVAAPAAAPVEVPPMVKVEGGMLQGARRETVVAFKNVPYAAPPVGERRWRAPAPVEAWSGTRDASRYGSDCLQNRQSWDTTASTQPLNEDCLYLNVWTPAGFKAGAKLPVLVAVHGGGFVGGSGSPAVMAGDKLAARGAVVVTFNYRLGRFGFFAHPALAVESAGAAAGNYGFMDQIAALQWVKRNIAAFGGDPSNVTLFGESAGGESIDHLMLADDARGLFHKAMVQSGGGRAPWPKLSVDLPNLPSAESNGRKFAEKMKLTTVDAAALRALPAAKVLGGINLFDKEEGSYSGPMIDGRLVTGSAAEGFAAGRQAKVPYWIGSNSDELGFIPGFLLGRTNSKLAEQFGFDVAKLTEAYGGKDTFEARFAGDATFVESARFLAGAASTTQPVYLWRFNYVTESKRKSAKGAAHATDVPYTFGNLAATGDKISDADRAAAQQLGDALLAFARTGVPAIEGQPAWPKYSRKDDKLADFSEQGIVVSPAGTPGLDAISRHFSQPAAAAQR